MVAVLVLEEGVEAIVATSPAALGTAAELKVLAPAPPPPPQPAPRVSAVSRSEVPKMDTARELR
ncbi:MAG: hypothetical protein EB084_08145 [Proteobacteria bacterium]|nr:hypothetical protein [Pseudomonadota bacterium]